MSLKGFHLFFITLATVLSFGFFAWTLTASADVADLSLRVTGIASALCGFGLCAYGVMFYKKSKRIIT